jgi:hypothetical protein
MEQQIVGWRKSSHSGNGVNCVEVTATDAVMIRDTTDRGGVVLTIPGAAWTTFLGALR